MCRVMRRAHLQIVDNFQEGLGLERKIVWPGHEIQGDYKIYVRIKFSVFFILASVLGNNVYEVSPNFEIFKCSTDNVLYDYAALE